MYPNARGKSNTYVFVQDHLIVIVHILILYFLGVASLNIYINDGGKSIKHPFLPVK